MIFFGHLLMTIGFGVSDLGERLVFWRAQFSPPKPRAYPAANGKTWLGCFSFQRRS